MATTTRQSQLRRHLPAALLVALIAAPFAAARVRAQYEASGYQPIAGEPFFLMSDKAYGSGDVAQVRLEVATRDFGMGAVESYGGVDVVLYRVPSPLPFLERQKNLHRISIDGLRAEEGLRNTLLHLWERWFRATRAAWRAVFTGRARGEVVKQAPQLATHPGFNLPTAFHAPPQFKPIAGFDVVNRFRYPVHHAASIQPPKGVSLEGSSSEFIKPTAGNVMIPLGTLTPGLYLVEAYVGSHRATTLVFASDTMAITKGSGREMFVWTANRSSGAAVRGVKVAWTDGAGVLKRGSTDALGTVRFERETPERSYIYGEDPTGGVFISENFYYDSEIHDTKLYAITDRPLYRPGDEVRIKLFARAFESARVSRPVAGGTVTLDAYDPGGAPIAHQRLTLDPVNGGDTNIRLPENSTAGGYSLRIAYQDGQYGAAFRVAEYQKPHFEITLLPAKPDFKSGEPISGRLQLRYPDGKPVAGADIELTVRSQQLTTVDGELRYSGEFPVKIDTNTLTSDRRGDASFTIPAASEPSRFLITATATDGAAYRVKTTRELLIERGQSSFRLRGEPQFSAPGEQVAFAIEPWGPGDRPASWEWVRQENRRRAQGKLDQSGRLTITFPEPGSYTVHLRDERGNVVAAAPHWVSGPSLRPPTGAIEIVPDKEKYRAGDIADLLISFPEPVDEALLTLERDRVENAAALSQPKSWVAVKRVGHSQWRARIPVRDVFAPNMTFSVAYVKNGDYAFQNQGLTVVQPTVDVDLHPDRDVYAPGDTVGVSVTTAVAGKPIAATLAVAVVDEMVYALQPEIAPDIYDFFFHARRNNVRTAASQDFISYDLAADRSKRAAEPGSVHERRVKVLERPRRDEVDTAFWEPVLKTDASGRAHFTFTMPDALTRWRITARGVTRDGTVGQRVGYLRSDKEVYAKWTSPAWIRDGDSAVATLAVFNQTASPQMVDVEVSGPALSNLQHLTLRPGVNRVEQSVNGRGGSGAVSIAIKRNGQILDRLETRFDKLPTAWPAPHTLFVDANASSPALALPGDAREIAVTFASSAAAEFSRVAEDLWDYPYGCIEQTASRMIPLALALEANPASEERVRDRLRYQLTTQRLRLSYMDGANGQFYWWGVLTHADPFLTSYAYYADWFASRRLGIDLPQEHWNRTLDVYRTGGAALPMLHRALFLHFMQEMKLPVKSLVEGLLADVSRAARPAGGARRVGPAAQDSVVLGDPDDPLAVAIGLAIVDRLARVEKLMVPEPLAPRIEAAYELLRNSENATAEALLVANGRLPATESGRVLGRISREMATLDRALALAWIRAVQAPPPPKGVRAPDAALAAPWVKATTLAGTVVWRWPNAAPPASLQFAQAPPAGTSAVVQYQSASAAGPRLPVSLDRRFYRVVRRTGEEYRLQPMTESAELSTSDLYLDVVSIAPASAPLRFSVLEVPLPPAASIETTTWGISVPGEGGKPTPLERSRAEPTRLGYSVPVDGVTGRTEIRNLVRFAQAGTFVMPRARLYRMYQPNAKAIESGDALRRMEVR